MSEAKPSRNTRPTAWPCNLGHRLAPKLTFGRDRARLASGARRAPALPKAGEGSYPGYQAVRPAAPLLHEVCSVAFRSAPSQKLTGFKGLSAALTQFPVQSAA